MLDVANLPAMKEHIAKLKKQYESFTDKKDKREFLSTVISTIDCQKKELISMFDIISAEAAHLLADLDKEE